MNVIRMEGLTRCDQWNYMMDAIAQVNQDAIPSSICILYSERYASLKAGIFLGQSSVSLPDSSDEVACKASKAKPAT